MSTPRRYFDDLDALLAEMPPGQLDMIKIRANERLHGHRFFDPPETVHQWLLDRQRRAQAPASAHRRRLALPRSGELVTGGAHGPPHHRR